MIQRKEQFPECVVDLAERFNLEACEVAGVVRGRKNAYLENVQGQVVSFFFGDNVLGMFRVACGVERADYKFMSNSDEFQAFYSGPMYPMGGWR